MLQPNPRPRKQLESKCLWHLREAASRLHPTGTMTRNKLVISGMFIFRGDVEHTEDGINLTTRHIHTPPNKMMALGDLEYCRWETWKKQRGFMQLKEVCTAVLVNTPMSSTSRISCLSDFKHSPSNNAITRRYCLAQQTLPSHATGYILKAHATRGKCVTGRCWVSMTVADAWKCEHLAVCSCEENNGPLCVSKQHVINVTACCFL